MRWRLILEEFGPELKYIKGENNVVADSLSCLEISDNQEILNISELYDNELDKRCQADLCHRSHRAQRC